MTFDISKISAQSNIDSLTSPIKLFDALPNKHPKYQEYLRGVQQDVLKKWDAEGRKENVLIRMNTGSGKTTVGLLILKTLLNSGKTPAVYIVSDKILVSQVLQESKDLGIEATDSLNAPKFISGKAILVISVKLFVNGMSRFSSRTNQNYINPEAIVFDDVHASIKEIEEQFTIKVSKGTPAYDKMLSLFEEELIRQSQKKFLDLKDGNPWVDIWVPFWEWQSKIKEVTEILNVDDNYKHSGENSDKDDCTKEFKFKWPLVHEALLFCNVIASGSYFELRPYFVPISVISGFLSASSKVFMSATLSDDTSIVTTFGKLDDLAVLTPDSASDVGPRMILAPLHNNPSIDFLSFRNYLKALSKSYNVIVLVSSNPKLKRWEGLCDHIINYSNIAESLVQLKNGSIKGLVTILNRYDGIDLPKDICPILVIDSIPEYTSKVDLMIQALLMDSNLNIQSKIQKIEQGMGRGVRSSDDHCLVFLWDSKLTDYIYLRNGKKYFSNATLKQFELSEEVAVQLEDVPIENYDDAIKFSLENREAWKSRCKGRLLDTEYRQNLSYSNSMFELRRAFDLASSSDYKKAKEVCYNQSETIENEYEKSLLLYFGASYENCLDQVKAQRTVKRCRKLNSSVPLPIEGIEYREVPQTQKDQSQQLQDYLKSNYTSKSELIIQINQILDKLQFSHSSYRDFEAALDSLGNHLGLICQRPDNDFGSGPDNLFTEGLNVTYIIECKNEADSRVFKKYADQLSGSLSWAEEKYPGQTHIPVLIHHNCQCESDSHLPSGTLKIDTSKLESIKARFREFFVAFDFDQSSEKVTSLLRHHNLMLKNLFS